MPRDCPVGTPRYRVAERMSKAQKELSLQAYEGKCRLFHSWCQKRHLVPLQASSSVIADYMVHLHEEEHLAVSTIEGYRTAISHTLKAVNEVYIGKDPHFSSLLSNFARVSDK